MVASRKVAFRIWARDFWQRVTEGMELQDLWTQFKSEARASYGLYSRDVEEAVSGASSRWRRPYVAAKAFFWAVLMKLSPARRVLLLLALALLLISGFSLRVGDRIQIQAGNYPFLGGLLLFLLLVLELADRVAMKRDLEIAREIQRWLVPEAPPVVPGVDIAFATRPANTVAGDYYDAFLRPAPSGTGDPGSDSVVPCGDRLFLAVADVAGKSVPAALLMATFQASLRALAASPISLSKLVAGLNRYACAYSLDGRRFTTAVLAELDPVTRALCYINAGHNVPLLRRASGRLERLEAGGLPLGIDSGASYELGSLMLSSGDLLVIFTDGLVEAVEAQGDEFGERRLRELVEASPATSAVETLRRLMAAVDDFVGATRQHDDITCLVLRAVPPWPI